MYNSSGKSPSYKITTYYEDFIMDEITTNLVMEHICDMNC